MPVLKRVASIYAYRELLINLVRKELKVKYKDSALGFFWSLLNPALLLVVYYVVFQLILGSGIPLFPLWLLSGLLVWNLFSTALSTGTASIVANSALVKKVSFPREVLPLASVGAALMHFFFQTVVLFGALGLSGHGVAWRYVALIPIALVVLLVLSAALAILLSAINVSLRDTQHLLELVLLTWFWATPIVYRWGLLHDKFATKGWPDWLVLINPVTPIVLLFQRALYNRTSFVGPDGVRQIMVPSSSVGVYLLWLMIVLAASLVLLAGAIKVFDRTEGSFAEEL